jgi:hypothetical protein
VEKKSVKLHKETHKVLKTEVVQKDHLRSVKHDHPKLPVLHAAAGSASFKGRLNLPQNIKPKLTLNKFASTKFQSKMLPFVQKPWKKAYFWVAIAGVGYITVPELYYDSFLDCIDDNDEDRCVRLLSQAAFEEEEATARVRYPMPVNANYRYAAKVAPSEVARENTSGANGIARVDNQCSLDHFVERKWNMSFVWVQIPQTGNVTVPEDYYDRFHANVAASPPDYQAACAVLVEAAAADMMTTAMSGAEAQPQQLN